MLSIKSHNELCGSHCIVCDELYYLHSDGQVLMTGEYWPTREAAVRILAKYPDAKPPVIASANTNREPAGLVSVMEMQEFIKYAKSIRFCNSGMHVCDRLANRFEKVLAQIKEGDCSNYGTCETLE